MNNESGKIETFFDLDAWKEGHTFVLMTYVITKKFPREEMFGLVSQMRRCAVSITSGIAEGFSRQSYKEKAQFYLSTRQEYPAALLRLGSSFYRTWVGY